MSGEKIQPLGISTLYSDFTDPSYSIMLDQQEMEALRNLDVIPETVMHQRRRKISWQSDESVTACKMCGVSFTTLLRRHHCRACGDIFCDSCSKYKLQLPRNLEDFPAEPDTFAYMLKSSLRSLMNGNMQNSPERVCNYCFGRYQEIQLIELFDLADLDVQKLLKLSCVSKSWEKAAMSSLSAFRYIQYTLPTHIFTEREKKLLWVNRELIRGHSVWTVKFIKSIDWNSKEESDVGFQLLNYLRYQNDDFKRRSCQVMMCTRICKDHLDIECIIDILSSVKDDIEVREIAIEALRLYDALDLLRYMQLFIFYLRYEFAFDYSPLFDFIVEISEHPTIRNEIFWLLKMSKNDTKYRRGYEEKFALFLTKMDEAYRESTKKQEKFIESLRNMRKFSSSLDGTPEENISQIKNKLKKEVDKNLCFCPDMTIPVNPEILGVGIEYDNIIVKISATMPLVIPITYRDEYEESKVYRVLYKSEDLRRDHIIVNLIQIMDQILKEQGMDMNIVSYNVLPTSTEDGLIEIVENAETIYGIQESGFSILNWIGEQNSGRSVREIKTDFAKSCAAFCVISYLLGFGDRHLENIMVTTEGTMFHIDFGYILGHDPKIISPEMRLTDQMIDVIGGPQSEYYQEFLTYSQKTHDTLRKHSSLIMNFLLLLPDSNPEIGKEDGLRFTRKNLEYLINQRFQPGEGLLSAGNRLEKAMTKAQTSYSSRFLDWLHYHAKEDTISKGINSVGSYMVFGAALIGNLTVNSQEES